MLVCNSFYLVTLKLNGNVPPKRRSAFNGPRCIVSQKIEILITTFGRALKPSCAQFHLYFVQYCQPTPGDALRLPLRSFSEITHTDPDMKPVKVLFG
jgi:hypothetical protein